MAIDPAVVSYRPYWLWICYHPETKKKSSAPLVVYKDKIQEDLSRGKSIAFVMFLFFLSLFLALRIFCLFVCFCSEKLECFLFDLRVFQHRRYQQTFALLKETC